MLVKCFCGQKFYTSTAELDILGGQLVYRCPKCRGYMEKETAERLEVIV